MVDWYTLAVGGIIIILLFCFGLAISAFIDAMNESMKH